MELFLPQNKLSMSGSWFIFVSGFSVQLNLFKVQPKRILGTPLSVFSVEIYLVLGFPNFWFNIRFNFICFRSNIVRF